MARALSAGRIPITKAGILGTILTLSSRSGFSTANQDQDIALCPGSLISAKMIWRQF